MILCPLTCDNVAYVYQRCRHLQTSSRLRTADRVVWSLFVRPFPRPCRPPVPAQGDRAPIQAGSRKRPKGDAVQAVPTGDLDTNYTPRYISLARLLRGEIEDGTYPPGSLLPSSKRLAAAHDVSTATALHALGMLVQSGHVRHIESKPHQVVWQGGQR